MTAPMVADDHVARIVERLDLLIAIRRHEQRLRDLRVEARRAAHDLHRARRRLDRLNDGDAA